MYKIEVKNPETCQVLGTEMLNKSLVLYLVGSEIIEFSFAIDGKKAEYKYKTEGRNKSLFKIVMNNDEIVILEEPIGTSTSNETVLIPEIIERVKDRRELGTLTFK